jgi:hypothetical protein
MDDASSLVAVAFGGVGVFNGQCQEKGIARATVSLKPSYSTKARSSSSIELQPKYESVLSGLSQHCDDRLL